jgi:flagellar hook-associated protein 1
MGSTFFGLNTALSGLVAQQRALNTVSHNLANATTPGYSRQRVDMAAQTPFAAPALNAPVGPGQIGTGVVATAHTRLRDELIDRGYRSQTASLGQFEARSNALSSIDASLNEPGGTGIASLLDRFWGSFQALSLSPESAAGREAARQAGVALAEGFTDLRAKLVGAQSDATDRIALQVGRLNDLVGQVNVLNQEIARVTAVGQAPNDLADRRDLLLDEMSRYAGVTVTPQAGTGKVSIAVGTQMVLDAGSDTVTAIAIDPATGNPTTAIPGGSIKGLMDVKDAVIGGAGGYLDQLDTLAAAVAGQVNGLHRAGYGLDGATGRDFFTVLGDGRIEVSAAVRGSVNAIATSGTAGGVPANADTAIAIAQLRFDQTGTIGATRTSIDGYYQQLVTRVGVDTDQASRLAQVQQGVLDAVESRRQAVSGVNIDEEVTDMVRFQKSYNSAARMITTLDEMLETIVSRMGLVGR